MKICLVCTSLFGGGAERFTANLANCLTKKGLNVFVLTGKKSIKDYQLDEDVIRLDDLKTGRKIFHDIITIRRHARKYKFDVIIGIDLTINICVSLSNIAFKPKVIISERNAPMSAPISLLSRVLRFLSYPFADGYVFQTIGAMRFYSEKIQRKSVVICNPIKENLPFRNMENKKEIIAVGRLAKEKNYELLIKAFAKICDYNQEYTLRIFGEGEQYENLLDLTKIFKIQHRVIFEGFFNDLHSRIESSDIYILTSSFEGMPNSLMEAMAMGFPVISTDCPAGGPAELIENMQNGILIKNNNLDELVEAISFYINNPVKKNTMGQNATEIRNTASSEVIVEQWIKYIKKICVE